MPNFDGTGPRGQGPMTGRGLGPCGEGRQRGWFGRFWPGRGWRAPLSETNDNILQERLRDIEERLDDIDRRGRK